MYFLFYVWIFGKMLIKPKRAFSFIPRSLQNVSFLIISILLPSRLTSPVIISGRVPDILALFIYFPHGLCFYISLSWSGHWLPWLARFGLPSARSYSRLSEMFVE